MIRRVLRVAILVAVLGACANKSRPAAESRDTTTTKESSGLPLKSPVAVTVPGREFVFTVASVAGDVKGRVVGSSWHEGCPVPLADLRYVRVAHWGFDGDLSIGELIVHQDVTPDIESVFRTMFQAEFPIRSMRLVDDFGADDYASIKADNTSAFNCRMRTDTPGEWSQHSYGRAIDVNPLENPYVSASGTTAHPGSRTYLDRTNIRTGMVAAGDATVAAFAARGWEWGGTWDPPIDYQHFSRDGR